MTLAFYFFRQFLPPLCFGTVLFLFVLLLDKLFDLIDLIFNKGVSALIVGKMFLLFLPTILPLTIPMAILLACVVTFGRLSEDNELTAVRTGGISLWRVFWLPPLLVFLISVSLIPFNTTIGPQCNKVFRSIYEQIIHADPLINIEPRRFFSLKNIKIYASQVDKKNNLLQDVLVYKSNPDGRPKDRIYARMGQLAVDPNGLSLTLMQGQLQQYDLLDPKKVIHVNFGSYQIKIPLNVEKDVKSIRFRNVPTKELEKVIRELKAQGLPTSGLQAESSLRYAIAFAPLALALVGIPLATVLKKGGRTFSFGVTLVVLFIYYLLLIFGLTLAEKGLLNSHVALWMANVFCFVTGTALTLNMLRK